jgi:hypothetical protein
MNDTPLVTELETALEALNVLSQNFSTVTGGFNKRPDVLGDYGVA